MNLNESFRYSNHLDNLLQEAYAYLTNKGFTTTTTEKHLKSKVNPDAKDEEISVQKPYDVEFAPNDVVDFIVKVIAERESLLAAISVAKANAEIDIDNSVCINKEKQRFANILNNLANAKPSETQTTGYGYKFDINGEQKKYVYDVLRVTSIDYDRNSIRALAKKLLKETDEVSAKKDKIDINTVVDFTPKLDVNGTFEEAIAEL